jgi:dihydrofolate reductase
MTGGRVTGGGVTGGGVTGGGAGGKVIADISMSLDGYVTGPDPDLSHGLGHGADQLHAWAVGSDDPVDRRVLAHATESTAAVVLGRRLFDIVDGPDGWNDEMGYGAGLAATPPFFVVTHEPPASVRLDLDFTFVTEGVTAAVDAARAVAAGGHVVVMGGGDVIRQCVLAGLVDELHIHLAPIVLGGGTPLFVAGDRVELVQREVLVSPVATHLTYAIP